jgi:hypothetical protein
MITHYFGVWSEIKDYAYLRYVGFRSPQAGIRKTNVKIFTLWNRKESISLLSISFPVVIKISYR